MTRATPAYLLTVATALLLQGQLHAVVDPFTDNVLVGGADNSGINWYQRSSNQTISIVNDGAGIGSGNALKLALNPVPGNQINRGVIGTFSLLTLANVGDEISLSFDFRFESAPGAASSGFRFGLYNSAGTAVIANATTSSDNDRGYFVSVGTGAVEGFDILKETNTAAGGLGFNDVIAGDPPTADSVSIDPTVADTFAINDTLKHTFTLTLTRNATGLSFTTSVDGTLLGTGTSATTTFLSFDEVVFSHSTPQNYLVDNVSVVPEPASVGFLGLGLAGLFLRRRR